MKKFEVTIEPGYIREKYKIGLPAIAGIYVVYKCDYNPQSDTIDIKEILYIGETQNIHERHNGTKEEPTVHEHLEDFRREAKGDEHICYGVIPFKGSAYEREWLEASLIHFQQPDINTDHKDHYGYPAAEVKIYGDTSGWRSSNFAHPFDYGDEVEDKNIWKN